MSEGYIGDPVKRQMREEKYRRMHEHWLKHGRDAIETAHYFAVPVDTVRRAVRKMEEVCGS
jgi:hypothetical protein